MLQLSRVCNSHTLWSLLFDFSRLAIVAALSVPPTLRRPPGPAAPSAGVPHVSAIPAIERAARLKAALAANSQCLLIDGKHVPSRSGRTFEVVNPADGETLARVARADSEDVELAVAAARRAFENRLWRQMSGNDRANLLLK